MGIMGILNSSKNTNALVIEDLITRLPVHPEKKYRKRSLDSIEMMVLHHSADERNDPFWHAHFHITDPEHLWPGIGYHFYIGKNGECYQTNQLNTISYHAKGYNWKSIGILTVGNFMLREPNAKQLQTLRKLISHLQNINPAWTIVGHKDTKATDCPGILFPLAKLKEEFNNI